MSDDRGAGRSAASALREAAKARVPQPPAAADAPYAEAEPIEDTVPYIPPLASYRLEAKWGEVRRGIPQVFPDEIVEDADNDA